MKDQRKRVAKRLASGLLAGALALGGLAISGGEVSARTPTSPSTNRIAGADRYETAALVARDQVTDANMTGLVIASGEAPYDALAGALLVDDTSPMLLVKKDSIPEATANFLSDYKGAFSLKASPKVYVLGGTGAISAAVLTAIQSAITVSGDLTPPVITRISGADRYATAAAVAGVTGRMVATDKLIIVNGRDGGWADALSASPMSAENDWPIVLTDGGLNASAQATIDAYLALPGSIASFVIVGGPLAVTSAVTDYLIANDVLPGSIQKIAGADRYQTNFLMQTIMNGSFGGDEVALVSGESPWDALTSAGWAASKNVHVVMTPAAGGNTWVSTLSATLSLFSTLRLNANDTLYVIGGRSAVSDAAKLGYAAAAANDLTATLVCPTTGNVANRAVTLVLSGALQNDYLTGIAPLTGERDAFTSVSAMTPLFKKNTVTQSVLTGDITSITDLATVVKGVSAGTTYLVQPGAAVAVGDVFTFSGWAEDSTLSSSANPTFIPWRSIGSASCTVTADTTNPTVSLRAVPGTRGPIDSTTSAGAHLRLTADEAITISAIANPGNLADNAIAINGIAVSGPAFAAPLDAGQDGYAKNWIITLPTSSSTSLAALDTVTIAAASLVDRAGNPALVAANGTAAADSTNVSMSNGGMSTSAASQVALRRGSLQVSAKATGSFDGAKGSMFSLTVNNVRGQKAPTIAIDTTAKTVVVTADVNYHTVYDVQGAALDATYTNPVLGNWVVGASPTAVNVFDTLTATVTPITCVAGNTCGTTSVVVTLNGAEAHALNAGGVSVAINGLPAPYTSTPTVAGASPFTAGTTSLVGGALAMSHNVRFTVAQTGTAVLSFTNDIHGVNDTKANNITAALSLTIS